jgi:hypothetical protein
MGLSVGVVSIDYLDEPQPPVSDFLKELAINPDLGLDDDRDYWGGGWGENTFLEFDQPTLTGRAENWCTGRSIDASGRAVLLAWLSGLPWRDGYVMLHLG